MSPRDAKESRPDNISPAIKQAMAGKPEPLFELLMRGSGLPGIKVNMPLAETFGAAMLAFEGPASLKFLDALRAKDPDLMSGGSPYEYLPVCAVVALGMRGARNEHERSTVIPMLYDAADDLRYRVRDAVPWSLNTMGMVMGDALLVETAMWTEQFNQAAALLRTMSQATFLDTLHDAPTVIRMLDESFRLMWNASRSAERYPGYKALHDSLLVVPAKIALRFGLPVFEMMNDWARVKEPLLREVISAVYRDEKLKTRFGDDVLKLRGALTKTETPRRDPKTYVGTTRGRGRKNK